MDVPRYDGKLVYLTGATTIDEKANMVEEKSSHDLQDGQ